MLYKYENEVLTEYQVKIDEKALKKIREKIIENCSIIEHCKDVFAKVFPKSTDTVIIKNMQRGEVHHIQKNIGWSDTTYYEYTYDKYYFPNIINIIDDILNGNEKQIGNLFNTNDLIYDINNYRDVSIFNEINNLLKDYIETNNENKLSLAKAKLNSFKHIDIQRQNKHIKAYYSELQECFEFQQVTTYHQDEINVLQRLFGDNWQTKIKEILKRDECMNSSNKKLNISPDMRLLIEIYRLFYRENPNFSDKKINIKIQTMMVTLFHFGLVFGINHDYGFHFLPNKKLAISFALQDDIRNLFPIGEVIENTLIEPSEDNKRRIKIVSDILFENATDFNDIEELTINISKIIYAKEYCLSSRAQTKEIADFLSLPVEEVEAKLQLVKKIENKFPFFGNN